MCVFFHALLPDAAQAMAPMMPRERPVMFWSSRRKCISTRMKPNTARAAPTSTITFSTMNDEAKLSEATETYEIQRRKVRNALVLEIVRKRDVLSWLYV